LLRSIATCAERAGARPDEPQADPAASESGAIGRGFECFARVVSFDRSVVGRSPRSVVATYLGVFDRFRSAFAATATARTRGFTASHFSFNTGRGRCQECEGLGTVSVDLVFLPDATGPCPRCNGRRYSPAVLEATLDGLTIADVLDLSVEESSDRFAQTIGAQASFNALVQVGLGGLLLGQPTSTLSGGEAQRIRLAAALQSAASINRTLYLLDEPSNGLHPADASAVIALLRDLADGGGTVVVADHDLRLVAQSDWMIDLGPGAGPNGGSVHAQGEPQKLAARGGSATADALAGRFGLS